MTTKNQNLIIIGLIVVLAGILLFNSYLDGRNFENINPLLESSKPIMGSNSSTKCLDFKCAPSETPESRQPIIEADGFWITGAYYSMLKNTKTCIGEIANSSGVASQQTRRTNAPTCFEEVEFLRYNGKLLDKVTNNNWSNDTIVAIDSFLKTGNKPVLTLPIIDCTDSDNLDYFSSECKAGNK